jgi:hypothetical protein
LALPGLFVFGLALIPAGLLSRRRSDIVLSNVLLPDSNGNELLVEVRNGTLAVTPEPGTLWLFLIGVAIASRVRKQRRSK